MSVVTSLERINPKSLEKAEWLAKRAKLVQGMGKITEVNSQEQLDVAGSLQTKAGKLIKALAKERLGLTRPLDAMKKEIMEQEKAMISQLQAEMERVKRINSAYATRVAAEAEAERQRIQAEEQAKAEAEMAKQQTEAEKVREMFGDDVEIMQEPVKVEPPAAPLPTGKVKSSANKMVTRWEFDIVDSACVPREFCTVDERKIRAYLKAQTTLGKDPSIEGVRFSKFVDVQAK